MHASTCPLASGLSEPGGSLMPTREPLRCTLRASSRHDVKFRSSFPTTRDECHTMTVNRFAAMAR